MSTPDGSPADNARFTGTVRALRPDMRHVVAITALFLLAHGAIAHAQAAAVNPVGVWRGSSTCLVRPSPCNDEMVVYRITRVHSSDSLSFDARKIVNGQEEEMGILGCRLLSPASQFVCTIPRGVWRFTVRGDSLVGELKLPDNTKYRDIRAARFRR